MSITDQNLLPVQKINALRRIQYVLNQTDRPLASACVCNEMEFLTLVDEGLIEVTHFADDGETLEIHRIEGILPKGMSLLAMDHLVQPPSEGLQSSTTSKICTILGKGAWDLVKIALAIGGSVLVAWLTWKYKWK